MKNKYFYLHFFVHYIYTYILSKYLCHLSITQYIMLLYRYFYFSKGYESFLHHLLKYCTAYLHLYIYTA